MALRHSLRQLEVDRRRVGLPTVLELNVLIWHLCRQRDQVGRQIDAHLLEALVLCELRLSLRRELRNTHLTILLLALELRLVSSARVGELHASEQGTL